MVTNPSLSVRILDLIETRGGMKFTDVQRMLWEMTHNTPFTRENRGWWCTNLLGTRTYARQGLLHTYCDKGPDGLWRRNGLQHGGKPWTQVKK